MTLLQPGLATRKALESSGRGIEFYRLSLLLSIMFVVSKNFINCILGYVSEYRVCF